LFDVPTPARELIITPLSATHNFLIALHHHVKPARWHHHYVNPRDGTRTARADVPQMIRILRKTI
jgi:hypothetical protein